MKCRPRRESFITGKLGATTQIHVTLMCVATMTSRNALQKKTEIAIHGVIALFPGYF